MRIAVLLVSLTVCACKTVYAPTLPAVPLLRQQGELRATAEPSNLQVAYGATGHLGLIADGAYRSETQKPKDPSGETDKGHGGVVEIGGGWFGHAPGLPAWMQLEVYGGAGYGTVHHELTPSGGPTRTFDASAVKYFIMPTLGVTRTYFDIAGSVRLVGVDYLSTTTKGYMAGQADGDGITTLTDRTWFFVEPVITLRAGYKWVKLQLDLGKSFKLSSSALNYDSGMVTIAVNVDLFRMFDR